MKKTVNTWADIKDKGGTLVKRFDLMEETARLLASLEPPKVRYICISCQKAEQRDRTTRVCDPCFLTRGGSH